MAGIESCAERWNSSPVPWPVWSPIQLCVFYECHQSFRLCASSYVLHTAKRKAGSGSCDACPAGQYQDGKGETSCKECDVDTYLSEPGKSSKADCTSCAEDRSTGFNKGSQSNESCLCKRTLTYQDQAAKECKLCPEGADCSHHDGILLSQVTAKPGFWRHENTFVNSNEF